MEKEKRVLTENAEEKMFASSSNIGGYEDRQDIRPDQDSNIQKQNLDIIKNILEMFNLEDTKRKYETQSVVEYVLDPNEFGYDCSLSTTRVRQRLNDLMGTDVIRLNDKRYFQKLSRKLQEEYDTYMDKQEDARCAAEDQRLRRLMLEGIINDPTDYRAIVHGERVKKGIKKKKKRRSKKRAADGSPAYTESTGLSRHNDGENEDRGLVTQVSILSGSRPSHSGARSAHSGTHSTHSGIPNDSKRHDPESRQTSPHKTNSHDIENSKQELHARPPHHEILRSSSSCSSHRKSRRVQSASSRLVHWQPDIRDDDSEDDDRFDSKSLPGNTARPQSKFSRHEPELVKTLRQEETVAGLYSLAEELVSPVKTEELVGAVKGKKAY